MPAVTGFYYFVTQQPLSGLGVLADHHWSVCVPLPIARKKETILFVCLPWHPFLLWSRCLLSPYPSWHSPNGSNSVLLLLGGMSSQQDTSPKEPEQEPRNRSFPSPHRQTMSFYLWPITSPCPILTGYRLVKSGPCACLSSMYVQNLPTAHAFAMVGLHSLPSVFDYFLVPVSFMACPT